MKILLLWLSMLVIVNCEKPILWVQEHWKYFDYVWDSEAQKDDYVRSGNYDAKSMVPFDIDVSKDGRTFLTFIRTAGVPASVHTVSDTRGPSGPLLKPYPDWSWYNSNGNCNGITSVYRITIDECNRIWLLDNGVIGDDRLCPAKLLAFNLSDDSLLFEIKIPDIVALNDYGDGLLVTPIVETSATNCSNPTVYMSDFDGNALVIWKKHRIVRLEDDIFSFEEKNSNFDIDGKKFYLNGGVLGMALSPILDFSESRYLFFTPLSSRSLYGVNSDDLQYITNSTDRINYYRGVDIMPSQVSGLAFSNKGTLFYGLTSERAIGCWNMKKPLEKKYFEIVIQNPDMLQFTSGMKVIYNPARVPNVNPFPKGNKFLLMMSNRYQNVITDTQNLDQINFRIMAVPIEPLIQNTVCDE